MANATNIAGYSMTKDPTAPNLIIEGGGNPVPGYTYTPHITEISGGYRLSWTNDGGLENPSPVNIYQGSDGLKCYYFDNQKNEHEANDLVFSTMEDGSIEIFPRQSGSEYEQFFCSPKIEVDIDDDTWTLTGIEKDGNDFVLTGKDSEGINHSATITAGGNSSEIWSSVVSNHMLSEITTTGFTNDGERHTISIEVPMTSIMNSIDDYALENKYISVFIDLLCDVTSFPNYGDDTDATTTQNVSLLYGFIVPPEVLKTKIRTYYNTIQMVPSITTNYAPQPGRAVVYREENDDENLNLILSIPVVMLSKGISAPIFKKIGTPTLTGLTVNTVSQSAPI